MKKSTRVKFYLKYRSGVLRPPPKSVNGIDEGGIRPHSQSLRGSNGRECEFVRSGRDCSTRFLAERQVSNASVTRRSVEICLERQLPDLRNSPKESYGKANGSKDAGFAVDKIRYVASRNCYGECNATKVRTFLRCDSTKRPPRPALSKVLSVMHSCQSIRSYMSCNGECF